MKKILSSLFILMMIFSFPLLLTACGKTNEKSFTISYLVESGIQGEAPGDVKDIKAGTEVELNSGDGLSKDNYYFVGWKYQEVIYSPNEKFIMPNSNVQFVAIFELNMHTISVLNGFISKVDSVDCESTTTGEYYYGKMITIMPNETIGKKFVSWVNQTGAILSTEREYEFELKSNLTIIANFKDLNKIEVINGLIKKINNIEQSENTTLSYFDNNESIVVVANEAPIGKVFDHWETNLGFTYSNSEQLIENISENIVLTAVFDDIKVIGIELVENRTYEYLLNDEFSSNDVKIKILHNDHSKNQILSVSLGMVEGFSTAVAIDNGLAKINYIDSNNNMFSLNFSYKVYQTYLLTVENGCITKIDSIEIENVSNKQIKVGSRVEVEVVENYDSLYKFFAGWSLDNGATIISDKKIYSFVFEDEANIVAVIKDITLIDYVLVAESNAKLEYYQNYDSEFNCDNIFLNLLFNNGATDSINLDSIMIKNFKTSNAGEFELIVSYQNIEKFLSYNVLETEILSKSLVLPKTEFKTHESVDELNATLSLMFKNLGEKVFIISLDKLINTTSAGNKTGTYRFNDSVEVEYSYKVNQSYSVQLYNGYISKINDENVEAKLTYGNFLAGTKLEIVANTNEDENKEFDGWYGFNNKVSESTYIIENLSQDLTLSAVYVSLKIKNLEIVVINSEEPIKRNYFYGQTFDVSNMQFKVTLSNGKVEYKSVNPELIQDFSTEIIGNSFNAKIYYKGSYFVEYTYNVYPINIQKISIAETNYKKVYIIGEEIDLTELYIQVLWLKNGVLETSIVKVENSMFNSSDFTTENSTYKLSKNNLTISYLDKTCILEYDVRNEFTLYIINGVIISVDDVSYSNTEGKFIEGANIVVVAQNPNNNTYFECWKDSISNIILSNNEEYSFALENEMKITAEFETDSIESISLNENYTKTYFQNDQIDIEHMSLKVIYKSGRIIENVPIQFEMISGFSTEEVGTNLVATINYIDANNNEKSLNFQFDVLKKVSRLQILSSSVEYLKNTNTEIIKNNLTFKVVYSDKSEVEINLNEVNVSDFSTSEIGSVVIQASYSENGVTCIGNLQILIINPPSIAKATITKFERKSTNLCIVSAINSDENFDGFNIWVNGEKYNNELLVKIENCEINYISEIMLIEIESVPKDDNNYSSSQTEINFDNGQFNDLFEVINNISTIQNFLVNVSSEDYSAIYGYNESMSYTKTISNENIVEEAFENKNNIVYFYQNNNNNKSIYFVNSIQTQNLFDILIDEGILTPFMNGDNPILSSEFNYFYKISNENELTFVGEYDNENYRYLANFVIKNNQLMSISVQKSQLVNNSYLIELNRNVNIDYAFNGVDLVYDNNDFIKVKLTLDEGDTAVGNYTLTQSLEFVKGEMVTITSAKNIEKKCFSHWIIGDETSALNPLVLTIEDNLTVNSVYKESIILEVSVEFEDYIILDLFNGKNEYCENVLFYFNLPENKGLVNDNQISLVFKDSIGNEYEFEYKFIQGEYNFINVTELLSNEDFKNLINQYGNKCLISLKLQDLYKLIISRPIEEGTIGEDIELEKEYFKTGEKFVLPNNPYHINGKVFKGWSDGVNVYQPNDEIVFENSNIILTPVFKDTVFENKVIVTFINTQNNSIYLTYEIESGDIIIPQYDLQAEGFALSYWYEDGATIPFNFNNGILENKILLTQWVNTFEVEYSLSSDKSYATVANGRNMTSVKEVVNGKEFSVGYLLSYYLGRKVTGIDDYAFYNYDGDVNVIINNTIEDIGNYSFAKRQTNNVDYSIIGFVGGISNGQFKYNTSIQSIGNYAFAYQYYFSIFNFGDLLNLKTIGDYAFANAKIATLEIMPSVSYIGKFAFANSTIYNLKFYQGGSGLEIDDYAFYNALLNFGNIGSNINNGGLVNTGYDNQGNQLVAKNETNGSYQVYLPLQTKSVGKCAFMQYCYQGYSSGIKSITFYNSITNIGEGAFSVEGLEELSMLAFNGSGITEIVNKTQNNKYYFNGYALYEMENDIPVKLLLVVAKNNNEFNNNTYEIPNTVQKIGVFAMLGNEGGNIQKVVIPSSVQGIGYGAFITHLQNDEEQSLAGAYEFVFEGDLPSIIKDGEQTRRYCDLFALNQNLKVYIKYSSINSIGNFDFVNYTVFSAEYQGVEFEKEVLLSNGTTLEKYKLIWYENKDLTDIAETFVPNLTYYAIIGEKVSG